MEPTALLPEMLEGLADHIRVWAPRILAGAGGEGASLVGSCSETIVEGWVDWLDACARGFRIREYHHGQGKSGRMLLHHPAKLLLAMFISYSVRGDRDLGAVSQEILVYMSGHIRSPLSCIGKFSTLSLNLEVFALPCVG